VDKGYWRLSDTSRDVTKCIKIMEEANEWRSPCKGGNVAGSRGSEYCVVGHKGVRCELCTNATHHFLKDEGKCVDCPSMAARVSLLLGVIAGGPSFVYTASFVARRFCSGANRHAGIWFSHFMERARAVSLIPHLKLAIIFFQNLGLLAFVYSVRLPDIFHEWTALAAFFRASETGWSDFILPGGCLKEGFRGRILLNVLMPLGLLIAILAVGALPNLGMVLGVARTDDGFRNDDSFRKSRLQHWSNGVLSTLPLLLFLIFWMVPSISSSVFAAWSCETFESNALAEPPTTIRLHRVDSSLTCDISDPEYSHIIALAIVFVVICKYLVRCAPEPRTSLLEVIERFSCEQVGVAPRLINHLTAV